MALGALIGAYQEDDIGGLRAMLPLAGRSLVEYQVRCAAAVGAAPIVVIVERIPPALQAAFDRLREEGIGVVAVSDSQDAAARFEAGTLILQIGDGVAPDIADLQTLVDRAEPAIAIVPDDGEHDGFERIDAESRWAGTALVAAQTLGATAAMLGDWDLQSTLLRRAIQAGAVTVAAAHGDGKGPLLAESPEAVTGFERRLILASRGARDDWVARHVLPIVEDFATERLMETPVRPQWLLQLALLLTVFAAFCFSRGWMAAAMLLLVLSAPLDLIANRLATLRLRPLSPRALERRLLWPASGLVLVALGWWCARHGAIPTDKGSGWGAMVAALACASFAEAARLERDNAQSPLDKWLFARRPAILVALPFAIAGWWNMALAALAIYATASFFFVQHWRHRIAPD